MAGYRYCILQVPDSIKMPTSTTPLVPPHNSSAPSNSAHYRQTTPRTALPGGGRGWSGGRTRRGVGAARAISRRRLRSRLRHRSRCDRPRNRCGRLQTPTRCYPSDSYLAHLSDKWYYVKSVRIALLCNAFRCQNHCPVSVYLADFAYNLAVLGVPTLSQKSWRLVSYRCRTVSSEGSKGLSLAQSAPQ
jgi:hypothetical protein